MLQIDRRIFIYFDYILPLLLIPIISISYFLIQELHPELADKQLIYFSTGMVTFILFFLLPIRKLLWLIPLFYWINIILLLSVEFFGVTKLGATRWLEIPFVNFTIQPSEIMKIAMILMLGYLIKTHPPEEEHGYGIKEFLRFSFYIIIPFSLILMQPDLGSALILLFVGYGVLFVIGVNYKIWLSILLSVIIAAPLIYNSLHEYQKVRIKDFLAEKPSYHVRQSIIAIGSGGLSGQEESEATQTHLKFLPIAMSDFIFSFYIERFGFWGGVILIMIYALIILHLLLVILYMKGDYLIQVLASSLAFLFFLYTGVNIAMTIGYAPVVGLPLPLFSYGGSSFMTFIILIGILENLLSFRHDRLYDSITYNNR
ncbi:MAG: rod shape-determining protein RodA [Epsilonproteobacteria bacterium]|nr:rod shape-determining protein RodA [Campylobacterota bacterium]